MAQPAGSQPQPAGDRVPEERKVNAKLVVGIVLAILLIWFVAVNSQSTDITFWIPTVQVPLWIALVIAIVLGLIIGVIVGRARYKPPKQ